MDDYYFPLIDEPTNHLDEHGRKITAAYLKRKTGFILVSHDRTFLDEATDHTMAINKTNIEVSAANFSTWWDEMKRREKFEESQNERLKKEISRLRKSEEAAERWSEASERKKIGFDPTKVEKSISLYSQTCNIGIAQEQEPKVQKAKPLCVETEVKFIFVSKKTHRFQSK